jgi:EpsI family protein
MKLATGVDHLIYGWLFFGLVMFIMFWIGSFWREDDVSAPAAKTVALPAAAPAAPGQVARMAAATLLVAAMWPAFAHYNERLNLNPEPVRLAPAIDANPVPMFTDWAPRYVEPSAGFSGAWKSAGLQPVGLTVLYYRNQDGGKALISSVNRLTNRAEAWHETASAQRTETAGGRRLALAETTLQGPQGTLLVWQSLWVGGDYTTSGYAGKLMQARSKLLFAGDDGAAVMVYAPFTDKPEEARAAMRAFLHGQFAHIDGALAAARGH